MQHWMAAAGVIRQPLNSRRASGAGAKHTEGQVRQHPPEVVCIHKVLHNVLSLSGFIAKVAVTDKRLQETKSMGSRA